MDNVISNNKVVLLRYKLQDEKGTVLDSSDDDFIQYYHGWGQLPKGIENVLKGHKSGDRLEGWLSASEGYGMRDESFFMTYERARFKNPESLKIGDFVDVSENGQGQFMVICELDENNVKMDGNHPLAGQSIQYEIEIKNVTEATNEEVKKLENETCQCGKEKCDDDEPCSCESTEGGCGCGGSCGCGGH